MIHVEHITLIAKLNLKTSKLRSSLCAYIDAYILVKKTISIKRVVAPAADNNDKEVVLKNCAYLMIA